MLFSCNFKRRPFTNIECELTLLKAIKSSQHSHVCDLTPVKDVISSEPPLTTASMGSTLRRRSSKLAADIRVTMFKIFNLTVGEQMLTTD